MHCFGDWEARLTSFDRLEQIENSYAEINGVAPYNVSHWDADPLFIQTLSEKAKLLAPSSPFEYVFSDKLPSALRRAVSAKLGYVNSKTVQLTPSGTSANILAIALTKLLGRKRLWVSIPVYFQVPIVASNIGIKVAALPTEWGTSGYQISGIDRLDPKFDAVWITNPMHGFGTGPNTGTVSDISTYLELGGIVVADECFCPNGMELARKLGTIPGFIGTYSPHKSICMNGVKLGILVADAAHKELLEQWSDVWVGPLTRMAVADAEHFLGKNYDDLSSAIHNKLTLSEHSINSICTKFDCALLGKNGLYRNICVEGVSSHLENSENIIRRLINLTGTSFIPAFLNYGPPGLPFSFRVNLARDCSKMEGALFHLLQAIRREIN